MITVIVNSYYRLNFLKAALDSVCNQSGNPDYEVILVTPFDSCPYTAEYGRRFAQIGVDFNEISLGPARTGRYLSAAASASRGDILAVLDDDDLWAPQKLKRIETMFSRHPTASYLHNGCHLIDEMGRGLPPWNLHRLVRHRSTFKTSAGEVVTVPSTRRSVGELSGFEPSFNNSSIAIRREVLLVHRRELDQLEGGEDAFLYLCGIASGRPLMAISDKLTLVRVHRLGATSETRTLVERNLRRNLLCQSLKEELGPTYLSKMLLKDRAYWELVKSAAMDSAEVPERPQWIRTILGVDAVPPTSIEMFAVGLGALGVVSPRLARAIWRAWRAAW